MKLLLDTSVLIDTLRQQHGRKELLAELVEAGNHLTTTAVNIAEVYSGVRPGEEEQTIQLLESLECYAIDAIVGEHAGRLKNLWMKRGHLVGLPDMCVAAVAIEQGCSVLTDNRKHFPMPEVKLYPLP
jgi:predicted nucleic acid-binding protein